jgi:pyrimidine-nucleoside phosphorylase/thymidine phosphorylase
MTEAETAALVEDMLYSGEVLEHAEILAPMVDKLSTGGVGDKTSLVIAPVAAACGVAVPMISGRALAHSGGTLDKLEAIPGFRTRLTLEEFRAVLKSCGLALAGQTREIAPADRKLYALRDLTATVPSRPLMCASIMSKKLAEGIDALVLDVKAGNGAFMPDDDGARALAEMMTSLGRGMGKRVVALITDMNQPLGRWVGNAVETAEAIGTLKGDLEGDFAGLCLELSAHMLVVGGIETELGSARAVARAAIESGAALERFRAVIAAQGGDPRVLDEPRRLPRARLAREVTAERTGYVARMATDEIGRVVMEWGGGRRRLEDPIDHSVGLEVRARLGDQIEPGSPLVIAHFNDEARWEEMAARLRAAYLVEDRAPVLEPLVKAVI